jgi:hypothetical protein
MLLFLLIGCVSATLDGILYINLPAAKQRRRAFKQTWKSEWKTISKNNPMMIRGIETPGNGHIGTGLSHIKALRTAYNLGWNTTLILEDDAHPVGISLLNVSSIKKDWFVIRLAGAEREKCDAPKYQATHLEYSETCLSTGTHAYIVRRDFIPVLLRVWEQTVVLLPPLWRPFESRAIDGIHYMLQSEYQSKWLYVTHANGSEFVRHGMFASHTPKKTLEKWRDMNIPYGFTPYLHGSQQPFCNSSVELEELCYGPHSEFEKIVQRGYAHVVSGQYEKARRHYRKAFECLFFSETFNCKESSLLRNYEPQEITDLVAGI